MIIYSSDVKGFQEDAFNGVLIDTIDRKMSTLFHGPSNNERISWQNSLSYMERIISRSGVPNNSGVAIEYMIPSSSKRIDFILTGYDVNNDPSVVIIELKQWSEAKAVEGKDSIVETFVGGGLREVIHPSYQAWSYAKLLEDFNESVESKNISLYPCSYLHNYFKGFPYDPLTSDIYENIINEAPLFSRTENQKLIDFLNRYIVTGDDREVLFEIDSGKIRPSKSLQDSIASMLEGNEEFTMIDDQKIVYENSIAMAKKSHHDCKKRVYIVKGGPGTGKSVVSINLLSELTNRNLVTHYVTKNSAPREVYKTKLKGTMKASSIDNLFKSSGSYVQSKGNEIDAIIVDEAHRLNEKSNFFGYGENQIKEIINAAKFSVFFVDDNQRITTKDIGESKEIKKWARSLGAIIEEDELQSQFRCNGSDGYLAWIDDVLQIRETANKIFDLDYDFDVVDTPQELQEWVRENNDKNKSRILSGYCWDWPKENRRDADYKDIYIDDYDFGISWNLDQGIWALDPHSVDIAGCIHTSQGLEFEYVGVIIGPDMYYENGEVKTDFTKRAKTDSSISGLKGMLKENPDEANRIGDEIVRNTYRTLLTRAMKGTRVFCTDRQLAEYLRRRKNAKGIFQNDYADILDYSRFDKYAAEDDEEYK